jgi:hypothetical protein
MGLRIHQSQGHAPGHPDGHPPVDAQVRVGAQPFNVGDKVAGGVRGQVRVRVAGQRAAAATAALVEQHRPVVCRVEVGPRARAAAAAGSSVEVDSRHTCRIADGLPVHGVPIAHLQGAGRIRPGRKVLVSHAPSVAFRGHVTYPVAARPAPPPRLAPTPADVLVRAFRCSLTWHSAGLGWGGVGWGGVRYAGGIRYAQGGGLTAADRGPQGAGADGSGRSDRGGGQRLGGRETLPGDANVAAGAGRRWPGSA